MEKYYKYIFISLFAFFLFTPKEAYAWESLSSIDLTRSYSIDNSYYSSNVVGTVNLPHQLIGYNEQQDRFLYGIRLSKNLNFSSPDKFTTISVDVNIRQESIGNLQNSINENATTSFAVFTSKGNVNTNCSVYSRDKSYTQWRCSYSFDDYAEILGFNVRLGIVDDVNEYTPALGSLTKKVVSDNGYYPYANNINLQYVGYDIVTSADPNTEILQDQLAEQEKTNQKLDETNKELGELNDNLTSEEAPDLDALEDSAGWLPPGPVDSILNLPLTFFNNLISNLSKTCQPVNVPLPYVNKNLTLPCISTLYNQIGATTFLNWVGLIVGTIILYNYFLNLYKWIDDTIQMKDNSVDDWGGV